MSAFDMLAVNLPLDKSAALRLLSSVLAQDSKAATSGLRCPVLRVQQNTLDVVHRIHSEIKGRRSTSPSGDAPENGTTRQSLEGGTLRIEGGVTGATRKQLKVVRAREEMWKKITYGYSTSGIPPSEQIEAANNSKRRQKSPEKATTPARAASSSDFFPRALTSSDSSHRQPLSRSLSISHIRSDASPDDTFGLQRAVLAGSAAAAAHFAQFPFRVRMNPEGFGRRQSSGDTAVGCTTSSIPRQVRGSSSLSLDVMESVRIASTTVALLSKLAYAASPNDCRLHQAWEGIRAELQQCTGEEYRLNAWGYVEGIQWVVVIALGTQQVIVALAASPVASSFVESFNTTCPSTSKTFCLSSSRSDPIEMFVSDAIQAKLLAGMLGLEEVCRRTFSLQYLNHMQRLFMLFEEDTHRRLTIERRLPELLLGVPRNLRLTRIYRHILHSMIVDFITKRQETTLRSKLMLWQQWLRRRQSLSQLHDGIMVLPTILSKATEDDLRSFVGKRMKLHGNDAFHLWVMFAYRRKLERHKAALLRQQQTPGAAADSTVVMETRAVNRDALQQALSVVDAVGSTIDALSLKGKIALVGHSVGGAIAILAALLANESASSVTTRISQVITVGAPRVFIADPADLLAACQIDLVSICHQHDPAPHHPVSYAPNTTAPFVLSPDGSINCRAWSDSGQVPAAAQLFWKYHSVDGYLATLRGEEVIVAVPHEPKCFAVKPLKVRDKVHGFSPSVVKALQTVFVKYCATDATKLAHETILAMCAAVTDPCMLPMHYVRQRIPTGRAQMVDFPLFLTWLWSEAESSTLFLHGLLKALRVRYNESKQDFEVGEKRDLRPYVESAASLNQIVSLLPPQGTDVINHGPLHHLFRHAARMHLRSPLERAAQQPTVSRDCVVQLLTDANWTDRFSPNDAVDYSLIRLEHEFAATPSSGLFTFAGDLTNKGFLRLMLSISAINPIAFENAMSALGYAANGVHIMSQGSALRDLHWQFGPCPCLQLDQRRVLAVRREDAQLKRFICDYAADEIATREEPERSTALASRQQFGSRGGKNSAESFSPSNTMHSQLSSTGTQLLLSYSHPEPLVWNAEKRLPSRLASRREMREFLGRCQVETSIGRKPKHVVKRETEAESGRHVPATNSDRRLRAAYHPANILRLRNQAQRAVLKLPPLQNHFVEDVSSDDDEGSADAEDPTMS